MSSVIVMIGYAAAACTLVTLATSPAVAAPYPAPSAISELLSARQATNAANSYQYRNNITGDTAAYESGGRYEQSRDHQIVVDGQGNFHQIVWPSQKVRALALRYLAEPKLQWERNETANNYNLPLWADVRDQGFLLNGDRVLRDGYLEDLFPALPTEFDKQADGLNTIYRTGASTYVVDGVGRIIRLVGPGVDRSWAYGPGNISAPDPGTVAPIASVRKAIQAATLKPTLRQTALTAIANASKDRATLARLRAAAVKAVADRNRTGDGNDESPIARLVPLRSANTPGGVSVFARNPYTHESVRYRIALNKHDSWRVRRSLR